MDAFLYQATIYLTAAIVAVPIASRLGLGSVLGYLLAGVVIGPILKLVGSETQDLQHFAEFGVVMMLFLIGLELKPAQLWHMRLQLLGLGGLQILVTGAAVTVGFMALGEGWVTALAIGMILCLSSTAIVLQTLNEKGLMKTPGGRSSFSVLLAQDIAVIPMLAFLPLLALPSIVQFDNSGTIIRAVDMVSDHADHDTLSLVSGLPAWGVTLVTIGAIVAVVLTGIFLTRPIFRFVHMAKLRELTTATALLIVISIAFLMTLVGVSHALGAFLAGMLLANSEFRPQLQADIEPFKGLLLGLFFITVGAGINFEFLFRNPGTILGLTFGLMLLKGLILFSLAVLFRLKGREKWLFTIALAQAGEFGFVLTSFALQQNVLTPSMGQTLLMVIALSMLLTPLFFILHEKLAARSSGSDPDEIHPHDEIDEQGAVIIAGIGRFGQVVNRMLQIGGVKSVVLDHDLKAIQLMRKFGFKGFYGDPSRPDLLHAAGLADAKVLVVAVDDRSAALKLIRFARAERPDLHIIARARDRVNVYELYQAGADDIVRELFDSSLRAARYALENVGFNDFEANEMEKAFYRHDRHALKELAALWKPGLPVSDNPAYVERARALNAEMETALVSRLDDGKSDVAGAPTVSPALPVPDPENPSDNTETPTQAPPEVKA
jgi:CPA2 family monovalent cation:H+ antiporter-2